MQMNSFSVKQLMGQLSSHFSGVDFAPKRPFIKEIALEFAKAKQADAPAPAEAEAEGATEA